MKKLFFILFLVVCYFPLFLHLDSESLYHWDEARNGINALEMIEHGNPLMRTYNGEPDTWETKPPFMVWLQVTSMKIFGYNELGVRLPSAFAALFTILLLFRFFITEFEDWAGGIFAGLTLLCTQGFVKFHVSRTGDHDALLSFFLTIVVLYFFKYLRSGLIKNRYLFITTAGVIFGVLTKSIMGFMMLPGILLFTVFKKHFLKVITKKVFWVSFFVVIISIGGYYLARELSHPGYLELVWENELFPRFSNTSKYQNHTVASSKFYYLNLIVTRQFKYFIFAFPILILFIFLKGEKRQKLFSIYILFCSITFLIIISLGTINSWYDAPVFPLLATLTGIGFSILSKTISKFLNIKTQWKQLTFTLFFMATIFIFPYFKIVEKVYAPDTNRDYYGDFFKKIEKTNPPDQLFIFYPWRNSSYLFYEKVYRDFKSWNIESCGYRGKIERCNLKPNPNQQVMICSQQIQNDFEKKYDFKIIDQMKSCKLYRFSKKE